MESLQNSYIGFISPRAIRRRLGFLNTTFSLVLIRTEGEAVAALSGTQTLALLSENLFCNLLSRESIRISSMQATTMLGPW